MEEFFKAAFSALPSTASSPLALGAYIVTIVAWIIIAWKVKRHQQLLLHLKELRPSDRLQALRDEMGLISLKENLTPEQYLRSKIHGYYFYGFIIICVVVIAIFAISAFSPKADLVSEYLQQSINYKNHGAFNKMLDMALKALEINSHSLDAIYLAAYAYLLNDNTESLKKGRDLLISKSNMLGTREKALHGIIEHKLDNHKKAYQILNAISLFDIDNEILPYVLMSSVRSLFETQDYDKAVYHMQKYVNFVKNKVNYYDTKVTKVRSDGFEIETNLTFLRIKSSQLHIGDIWLVHAYNNKHVHDWIKAINVATEGFETVLSVNTKRDILNFLSLFNETIKNDAFLIENTDTILKCILRYVEVLSGMKSPSYSVEIVKLKLMYNAIIDKTVNLHEKLEVYANDDVNFSLCVESKDESGVKSVRVQKNFIINEERDLLSGGSPRKVFSQIIPLKVESGTLFHKDEIFAFTVVGEDIYSNASSYQAIPCFFRTRFE